MVSTEPEIRRTRSSFLRFSICIETKIENNRQGITFSFGRTLAEPNWIGSKSHVSNKSGIFVFPKVFKEFVTFRYSVVFILPWTSSKSAVSFFFMRGKFWPPSVVLPWICRVAGSFLEEKWSQAKAQKIACTEKSRRSYLLKFVFVVAWRLSCMLTQTRRFS